MTKSSRRAADAIIGAEPFWPGFDEIAVNGVDGQIIIQAPPGEGVCVVPFIVGDVHNLYEWSMMLGDLHPVRPLGALGTADEGREDLRKETIDLFERPRAIFKALKAACTSKRIKHVKTVWHEEDPVDITLWRLHRADVLEVLRDLGADGEVIRMLMAEREWRTSNQEAAASGEVRTDASETVALTPPRSTPRPRAPDGTARAWYEEHLKKHMDNGTPTSGEDDWTAATEEFGDRIRQAQIRALRRELAPSAWRKQGRRPTHT